MRYATIKYNDIANGEGVRVSLFVSGCRHGCPGCFNREAWDFSYGEEFTDAVADEILTRLGRPYVQGLSLLGGEPFEPEHQPVLADFLGRVRDTYPGKDVWCYTGFVYEELIGQIPSRARTPFTDRMLDRIDFLVDGRFIEARKNLMLRFRGSDNQRILDLAGTRAAGVPVLWEGLAEEHATAGR